MWLSCYQEREFVINYDTFVQMGTQEQRRILIAQAAALITTLYVFFLSRIRREEATRPQITYGPRCIMDEERQRNLDNIYNCNDIECVNMLRMRRAPFFPPM